MKEWLQKRNELKLSSVNDFLNFLQMDEGTFEELLNKNNTLKYDAISLNQRISIMRCYVFLLQAFLLLKLVEK